MYKLRSYQQEAVSATIRHFQRSKKPALVVLPTGAGKSLVIAELARLAKGRVLVLAHVKELVEQNHEKYQSYGLEAGIYAAGLDRKESHSKVIFGSIQSVARASDSFFQCFSLLIIDECHRVSLESGTQYAQVIGKLQAANPGLCILGLTATPYRLGLGWVYQYHQPRRALRTEEERFFKICIFELTLSSMIKQGFLTPPIRIDAPVACYDFSKLKLSGRQGSFSLQEIETALKDQRRITPSIVQNIIDMAHDRRGVMIFTASVRHAEEIMGYLPYDTSALVVGETVSTERDAIIRRFKQGDLKYLVNVSVLTTGFDAPHVDLIAILRPTESISLYQQIVGRGLRLSPGKVDCLILDYTGQGHEIFAPDISEDKPSDSSIPVEVTCPQCGHLNHFWGLVDDEGTLVEHFGRKCQGATQDEQSLKVIPCNFRFRFKRCMECGAENDIAARVCSECDRVLVDTDKKLKEAMSLKDAHVMRPDSMTFRPLYDRQGRAILEVKYFDCDGEYLRESFFFHSPQDRKAFYYKFVRFHLRIPEREHLFPDIDSVVAQQHLFRLPAYIIARKNNQYWEIREKIFP
jgi:DNA repair protein RadD